MTKKSSTIVLVICIVVLAFVGVFTFIPVFPYGEYGEFYSPATLIQKSNWFTDSLKTTYTVDLDDDVTSSQVGKIINKRLGSMYGLYSSTIDVTESEISVTVPEIAEGNSDGITAETLMDVVTARGVLEILNETTYDASNVVLSNEHFRNATTRTLTSAGYVYYVAIVNLNSAGQKALSGLTASSGTYAIDGTITLTGGVQKYNDSTLYLYGYTLQDAKELAGYVNSGVLQADLTRFDSNQVSTVGGLILAIALAVIVVALAVFYILRYKALGIVAIISQLFSLIVGTIFGGLVSLQILNIFSVVGILLGIALQTYITVYTFDNISSYDNAFGAAKYKGFVNSNKRNLIVHAIALVVGIILWVIPTAVTAPLGNVIVYLAVLSFIATMGLNRLFANVIEPFVEGKKPAKK